MQRVCPSMIGKNAAPLFVDTACYPRHALDEWTIAAGWAGCQAERAPIDTNSGSWRKRGLPGA